MTSKYATDGNFRPVDENNAAEVFEYYVRHQIDVEKVLEDTLYHKEKLPTQAELAERLALSLPPDSSTPGSPLRSGPARGKRKFVPLVLGIPADQHLSFADRRLQRQVAEYNASKLVLSKRKEHEVDQALLPRPGRRVEFTSDNFNGFALALRRSLAHADSAPTLPGPQLARSFRTTFHDNLGHLSKQLAEARRQAQIAAQVQVEECQLKAAFETAVRANSKQMPQLKISSSLDQEAPTRLKTDFSESEENRRGKKKVASKMHKFIEQLHATTSAQMPQPEVANSSRVATNATEYLNLDKSRPSKDTDCLDLRGRHLDFLTPRSQHLPAGLAMSPGLSQPQTVEGRARPAESFAVPTRAFQIKKQRPQQPAAAHTAV